MTEIEIKRNFAKNIRELRISRGLNQIQFGEKIHYTSKAVSKWENEDVLPDIVILNMIADFFNVTVDDLISNKNIVKKSNKKRNTFLITASSCLLSFFIAAIIFLILSLCNVSHAWWSFIIAVPSSAVTFIVLSSLWFNKRIRNIGIIFLIWSTALMVLVFMNFNEYFWIILLIAVILSIISIVFFNIHFKNGKNVSANL